MSIKQPTTLPLQTRLAPLGDVSVDTRTVDVVWTTGATVRRARWSGWDTVIPFDEELVVSDKAVDLSRLKAGAPVLDSHCSYSLSAVLAVVDDAWLEGGRGLARFRFPDEGTDENADRTFKLVRQKIIRNVSVGYAINRARIVEAEKKGDIERRIIESWTPYEISFVTIPADADAQTRAAPSPTFPVDLVGRAQPIPIIEAARARLRMEARRLGLAA